MTSIMAFLARYADAIDDINHCVMWRRWRIPGGWLWYDSDNEYDSCYSLMDFAIITIQLKGFIVASSSGDTADAAYA